MLKGIQNSILLSLCCTFFYKHQYSGIVIARISFWQTLCNPLILKRLSKKGIKNEKKIDKRNCFLSLGFYKVRMKNIDIVDNIKIITRYPSRFWSGKFYIVPNYQNYKWSYIYLVFLMDFLNASLKCWINPFEVVAKAMLPSNAITKISQHYCFATKLLSMWLPP